MRIFVDMDGTLAQWNNVEFEQLFEKGYYRNLLPNSRLIQETRELIKEGKDVYILSSYLTDSDYALEEKRQWLLEYLPELNDDHKIFVPYGTNKAEYLRDNYSPVNIDDYLIDDYTANLIEWKEYGGTGVKYLNGINHTRGTWDGLLIQDYDKNYSDKATTLLSLIEHSPFTDNTVSSLDDTKIIQADNLPAGWKWIHYDDASGHLESPDGTAYFTYDWSTGEYKVTDEDRYDFFLDENYYSGGYSIGSFSDFKKYAENYINENILNIDKERNKTDVFKIENIITSLSNDVKNGNITISDAAQELYESGLFNYIPDEEQTLKKLGLEDYKKQSPTKNTKYELTDEIKQLEDGTIVYRIVATKDFADVRIGDKGGFIEDSSNLMPIGNCWVYDNAVVSGTALVADNAMIKDFASVSGNSFVSGNAEIRGNSCVTDNSVVSDNAIVKDDALVAGYAIVNQQATISDRAKVVECACISGNATVKDNAAVYNKALITEQAIAEGFIKLGGAKVYKGSGVIKNNVLDKLKEIRNNNTSHNNATQFELPDRR